MYTIHDDKSMDPGRVRAVASVTDGFGLFDYVSIKEASGSEWIGQIVVPNINVSTVGDPLSPTILHGLQLAQSRPDVRSIESIQVYEIMLLGQSQNGQLVTARLRPLPGSAVVRLDAASTIRIIGIPALRQYPDGNTNAIGYLANAEGVPLCVTPEILDYHVMVVGGTGSGKSNAASGLVAQSVLMNKCVIIHDVKPDYRYMKNANTDQNVLHVWKAVAEYGLKPYGMQDVLHVGFKGLCDPDSVDRVIGFQSSDFDPDLLGSFFFNENDSEAQSDGFAAAAHALKESQLQGNGHKDGYTLDGILAEVRRRSEDGIHPSQSIHPSTAGAIERKVSQRKKSLPWLDAIGSTFQKKRDASSSAFSSMRDVPSRVSRFDLHREAAQGRILLIDYGNIDSDAAYALLLSWFLGEAHRYRRSAGEAPIVQLIDEAHRVFDNKSRHSKSLESKFNRVMREGRSKQHSIILSLQNATEIPSGVMNNLNSKIVMKQNNVAVAKAATQTMGGNFEAQSRCLGTGQALVSLHEAKAVVLAQISPSPFDLMRSDNIRKG